MGMINVAGFLKTKKDKSGLKKLGLTNERIVAAESLGMSRWEFIRAYWEYIGKAKSVGYVEPLTGYESLEVLIKLLSNESARVNKGVKNWHIFKDWISWVHIDNWVILGCIEINDKDTIKLKTGMVLQHPSRFLDEFKRKAMSCVSSGDNYGVIELVTEKTPYKGF